MNYDLTKQKINQLFNTTETPIAKLIQAVIVTFILYSGVEFFIEVFHPIYFQNHLLFFDITETIVVLTFTTEYLVRFWATPQRTKFIFNFYNIIDILAVVPFFLIATNISILRSLRILRLLRATRLLRAAKGMKYIWGETRTRINCMSKIVQENIIKNIAVIIILVFLIEPIKEFFNNIKPDAISDVILAVSIFAVAAMFGFFSMSYGDINPHKLSDRMMAHITSGLLIFPIGMMFMVVQMALTQELNMNPILIESAMWLLYFAIVLWDFMNVKRAEKNISK